VEADNDQQTAADKQPAGQDPIEESEDEPDAALGLVGKAAPPIDQELVDGTRFQLANHCREGHCDPRHGATWCGPCLMEMPVVAAIAAEYKSKGVVAYAVNKRGAEDDRREIPGGAEVGTSRPA